MNIAIIGAGKWGQALYHAFSQKNSVVITSRSKKNIANFVSIDEALKREWQVIVIPAQSIREWMREHFIDNGQNVLVAAKGIEISSGALLNDIFYEFLPPERVAFLSGPSFAAEVMQSLPTALVVSSKNIELAQKYVAMFPDYIKGYADDDIIGAEVGGAYKNVIAIAGGVCDGLNLGNNARVAMISRGLVEMSRYGIHFGAKIDTFLSLGGAGDLFLSASSRLSRNYRVGLGLAQGKSIDEILQNIGEVAEGVGTAKAINNVAKRENLYLPIATEVYNMINGKEPQRSVRDLLGS